MLRERSENGAKHEVPPQNGEARREYENAVARGRVVDQDVGDCSNELAVLDDGGARHECGQEGTTKFTKKCF